MKKSSGMKNVILVLIMAGLVIGYYFYLSNRDGQNKEETVSLTEVQEVLLRDMEKSYPPSPKEVVKYYAQISKCFYDGDYSEEELKQLAERARSMYDEELKATQTEDEYWEDLRKDIDEFKEKSMTISSYSPSASTDVEYTKSDTGELATLYCIYSIRQGTSMNKANHKYVLRKDEDGHWKILGWELDDEDIQ